MKSLRHIALSAVSVALLIGGTVSATANADDIPTTSATATVTADASPYGCTSDSPYIRDVPHRLFAAWGKADANGVAAVFTTDGHMIPSNGAYLTGQSAIAAYYAAAFQGPLAGTRVIGEPLTIHCLSNNLAVVDGLGGILKPGDTYTDPNQVPIGQRIIVSWTAVRNGNTWYMQEFQSTLIQG